ncbi:MULTISPECIES: UDP-N-acetylglucosamine 2-epimerase [unclassified Bradyrhizobium]|uniref:UDP-N-acetylglucosamine 2-epimerase n=1 Tax=unclassified Bradyrhizobium TaxID=2631580 RepID=UPI001FFE9401|nr:MULTISPECIES: UDP-N-acetylglucosamine 2-epimerase [unclassified Bradyrhizobium]UPJ29886.1 UDP-N-acetylglucosamine 2-epimerase (hydrolyzing) [Bradyrhizobium sp. CW1]UPJ82792.1 UDP-N-acetylglucosamine 2-epimerase (hydrolyzing) [Bradyrhizobium sp. 184]UPJ90584.1 UDP-N-acetylglucosamine 2-epimerase (hydrolyzing) [Bradyrhizobium sp. 183]
MSARRRIAVVTGSRADYGLLRGILARLRAAHDVALSVIGCGMHLVPRFGETWKIIEADGFPIAAKIDLALDDDRAETIARGTGIGVSGFAEALPKLAPDVLVVLGDRYEVLAASVAATLLNIPIAHIHGGEITAGAFDDAIRHAITKMACLHFVAAEPYRRRVIQMGEQPDFVFNVGAPGLDLADSTPTLTRAELFAKLGIGGPERFLLVTLHPTTAQPEADAANVTALLGALAYIEDRSFIFTGVNADPGYRAIDDAIRRFVAARPDRAHLFTSLGSERYWSALRLADAVVGNSSSGILEAPAVGVPTINIGDRQKGRLRAASIIDCPANSHLILASLRRIFEGRFQPDPAHVPPYGRGGASEAIAATLRKIELKRAFPKYFHDLAATLEPPGPAL